MNQFEAKCTYTRPEISGKVGGDLVSGLPHSHGQVVCVCLKPKWNILSDGLPEVILIGQDDENGKRWGGEVFAKQREYVSVFIKRAPNKWEYVGEYRVADGGVCEDRGQVDEWGKEVGRPPTFFSMGLRLEARPSEGASMSTPSHPLDTSIPTAAIPVSPHDPAVPAEVYAEVARLGLGEHFPAAIALTREIFGDFTIDISVDPEIKNFSHVTFNVRSSGTLGLPFMKKEFEWQSRVPGLFGLKVTYG
jgi:hypothetical protein